MKTIAIDAVGIDRVGGGRTSILSLLRYIFALDQETRYLVLVSEYEVALKSFSNVRQIIVPIANRFAARIYLQIMLPILVQREQVNLVHFAKNLGVIGLSCPYLVTVHDLTVLHLREYYSLVDVVYWRLIEPLTVRYAAKVIAVSQDTARDIRKFYRVSEQNISVIPWAPQEQFVPIRDSSILETLRQRYSLPDQYLLFVGILAKKKNLPTLLKAFALLRSQHTDVPDLVVIGRRYPQSDDNLSVHLVHELGLDAHVHFIGSVPDEDLPLFYNGAKLYVLPALHEGFGIPCLEAMACGVPVVTTRVGAIPEVVGDAALLVNDPLDFVELCASIERALYDDALRREMTQRGLKRASDFSWKKSAQKMLDIYHSLLNYGE